MESQAGGRSGPTARLLGPQLVCTSWSHIIFFNTSEERVLRTEQLKPTYITSRAQNSTAAEMALKISGRWKLRVCPVVTAAARDALHLQLALRRYTETGQGTGERTKTEVAAV